MHITRLEIQNVRNIERAELCPAAGYNLITGHNGSGKSSILEAIHCLSTGKSFRTNRKQPLITHDTQRAIIFAELDNKDLLHRAGILKRSDGSNVIKLDGRVLDNQTPLASLLPVIGHTPESDDLLAGSSKVRQTYLDWLLFHVEPTFRDTWRNYRRVLQQRNSALREKSTVSIIQSWDHDLVTLGLQLTSWRQATFHRIVQLIDNLLSELMPTTDITFSYRQGWNSALSLREALNNALESDRKSGFTHSGPHRADIQIMSPHGVVTQELSRGQRKVLTLIMRIAQFQDMQALTQRTPILYIDDMPAELDSINQSKLIKLILDLSCQVFITATSRAEMLTDEYPPLSMFHVEQGKVSNVI